MSSAIRKLEHETFADYTASAACTEGELVVFASDTTVQDAGGATDLGIGVAAVTVTTGARVQIMLFGPVIPVECGTGGATRGTKAIAVADGFTDAPAHDSDNSNNSAVYGIFMQTKTAGQKVGLMLGAVGNRGNA